MKTDLEIKRAPHVSSARRTIVLSPEGISTSINFSIKIAVDKPKKEIKKPSVRVAIINPDCSF